MIPYEVAIAIPCLLAGMGFVVGYRTGRCSKDNPCPKCAFHTNEQRVERLEIEQERVKYKEDQALLRHDYEHKGGGFLPNDPDRFPCPDATCARNPKRVDSDAGGK